MRKLFVVLTGLLAMFLSIAVSSPAFAQDAGGGESLRGTLRYEGDPVTGVGISVTSTDGEEVGSTESGADGTWNVPVPGPGEYTAALDVATLPDGVPPPGAASVTRTVDSGRPTAVIFALGGPAPADPGSTPTQTESPTGNDQGDDPEAVVPAEPGSEAGAEPVDVDTTETEASVESGNSLFLQLVINGLRFGLILGLAALGLSLVFGTTGLTNFAHGELIVFGAVAALLLNQAGLSMVWATLGAVILAAGLGWAQDRGFWRPLRKRKTGLVGMMIISIGVSLIFRYLTLFIIGGSRQSYNEYVIQRRIDFGPISIAPRDLIIMGICVLLLIAVAVAMLKTRIGKATRAISDNPSLAASSGINVDSVITSVWVAGTALAALSGVFLGFIQQVDYLIGFRTLLLVFAAVILGGLGSAWGAMIGALIIGVFLELSTYVIPSEMKNAGALIVLIVILLVRPQGLLGRRERIG